MDKMTIWSFLLVTLPEVLLIVATAMSFTGYADLFNFKYRSGVLKLLYTALAGSVIIALSRAYAPAAIINLTIVAVSFPLLLLIVYRRSFFTTFLGYVAAQITVLVPEAFSSVFMLKLLGLTYEQGLADDFFRFIVTLPVRLCQLMALLLICRAKRININTGGIPRDELIKQLLFGLMIISSLISIESGIKNLDSDFNTMLHLIINIILITLFSSWTVFSIFKLRKRKAIDEKIRDFELKRIKKLLSEGYTDHVIELIDSTLKEGR